MPFVEPQQDVMVRMLHPVSHRYGIWSRQAASSFRHERTSVMKPYSHTLDSTRGWLGWRSHHLTVYRHAKFRPSVPVQSVNELGDEPRGMIQRQQLVKCRRQHPHLLSPHRSKRHLIISPIDVASRVHLTTYSLPAQTSETGSTANFSLGGFYIGRRKPVRRPV